MISKKRFKQIIKRVVVLLGLYGLYLKLRPLIVKVIRVVKNPGLLFAYLNIKKINRNFAKAKEDFYKYGKINEPFRALDRFGVRSINVNKSNREFYQFLAGQYRLLNSQSSILLCIPPRQPNPGVLSRRKHLLYCLHQSVPHSTNGYSTRSHGIAVGLQQAGWQVSATTRTGYPWDSKIKLAGKGYHQEVVDGVTYTACAGWNLNKAPLDRYLAEASDHFFREAQLQGAEVVVAASNHITALPALIAARRLGVPFVYEVRGLWEVTQASTQPDWADSERFHLMKRLETLVAKEADHVMTLTEELAKELGDRGVAPDKIHLAPNAVDPAFFAPQPSDSNLRKQLELTEGTPVIGYAGSAVAYEGLDLLLDALADLNQQKIDFTFVLVGDGKALEAVKQKASELNLLDKCRFPGRVAFDQIPAYISCMDILPIPRLSSPVTELVSPLKPLEAMSMAKAVVLSDVAPHKAFAGNNERALLFEKDNTAALSQALTRLIKEPVLREKLGKTAREWVVGERTWQQVTASYSTQLEEVVNQAKSNRVNAQEKKLNQITLGLVADEFTTTTLASSVDVLTLSPDSWQKQLEENPVDAIFIESAWKGNKGQWHRKVGYYSDEEFAELKGLLDYCCDQGIPSLFWNKEDPVHFERFKQAAAQCDHVFTTDSRRIIPYLSLEHSFIKTASSCPFFASPTIHNPLPSTREWKNTAAYGGTYYGERYPERSLYMDMIMSAAAPLGLTIYDRQHKDLDSPYKYPNGPDAYVEGGLTYDEMIQAYKGHPVQLNVNSVLDSPTMFSRRVVEAAACGAALVSGPALGMNRYLGGSGHVVRSESEAAEALEQLLHHPAYRWRAALAGERAVMRAHTTEHRLTQMLRTAGLIIEMPELSPFSVHTKKISRTAAERLLKQTVWPQLVVAEHWDAGAQALLEQQKIACHTADDKETLASRYSLIAEPEALEDLEDEDFEDLMQVTRYASFSQIGFNRSFEENGTSCKSLIEVDGEINPGLQLINSNPSSHSCLALHKPPLTFAEPPEIDPEKTVLIAGHDLKFIKPFYPYFTKAGIRVLLDFWQGHSHHDEATSQRLSEQADTVFCEWTLGNAIWYGKHKRDGQKLVGRLHAQEMRSPLFDKLPFEAFDTVIFVGPHILRNANKRHSALKKNGVVIYNGVDIEAMQAVPRRATNGKVLGLVGMVPQSKRLDHALDILKELRREDKEYTLRVKGKRPEDYPWMAKRTEEMAWYDAQDRRMEEDPDLEGAVYFDPHGNDMPEWYAGIDYILSVSDHESFHLAIAEGAMAGCIPVSLPWEGADEIYPEEWVYSDVKAATDGIKKGPGGQAKCVEAATQNMNQGVVAINLMSVV